MYYFVAVQPWLRIPSALPEIEGDEEIVSIDTDLGRSFIVEAKNQNQALARVVRDCVNIRKATPKELIKAGKSGEVILSADDPLPAPAAVEPPPVQASLVPAGDPPPSATFPPTDPGNPPFPPQSEPAAAPAQEQPWDAADLKRARDESGVEGDAAAVGF